MAYLEAVRTKLSLKKLGVNVIDLYYLHVCTHHCEHYKSSEFEILKLEDNVKVASQRERLTKF
jgi:aryl-alcohol dehydrogenase-like predicted oxidoreductase